MIFGGILGIHLWICKRVRAWQVGLLALISAGAYAIAFLPAPLTFVSIFLAGIFGAFVLLAAIFFLVFPKERWTRVLGKAGVWSLWGGALGTIGWALGQFLGPLLHAAVNFLNMGATTAHGNPEDPRVAGIVYSIHVVWQTGIGIVLAVALNRFGTAVPDPAHDVRASVSPGKKKFPIATTIFFFAVCTSLVTIALYQWLDQRRTKQGLAKCIAAEPAIGDLPSVQNVAYSQDQSLIDQGLVTQGLGPYTVGQGRLITSSGYKFRDDTTKLFRHVPPTETYWASYERPGVAQYLAGSGVASVTVTKYPNTEWAKYELENSAQFCIVTLYPAGVKNFRKVTRSGENIFMYSFSGGRDRTLFWTAGNRLMAIHYNFSDVSDTDDLLNAYLKKYPSDLRQFDFDGAIDSQNRHRQ